MKMLLLNQSRDRVPKAWLERWIKALTRVLVKRGHKTLARKELVIVFVTSGEIRRLNRLYRRKDYATDVLSFAPAEASSAGELVLCLPVIRRQSRSTGLGERGELGYMIVHGVLHLLGFDHMKKREEAEMFALQDAIYAELEKKVGRT
jgi:probable rRNA maturation factor